MGQENATSTTMDSRRGIDWPIVAFFALSYAIAWTVFGLMAVVARQAGLDDTAAFMGQVEAWDFAPISADLVLPQWLLYGLTRLADFSFSIAGVVFIALTAGRDGLRDLWARLTRWRILPVMYIAGLLPFFLYTGASALAAFGNPEIRDSLDLSGAALTAALFGVETGIVFHLLFRGAMGEELGLRGFALPRLQARYGAVRASLIIGVFWYLWHLPVLIGRGPVELVLFGVLVIFLTFIFTWLYNGSGGSLIPGLLFHAIQNSEDAFERVLPAMKGTDWEAPATIALFLFGIAATVRVVRRHRSERATA